MSQSTNDPKVVESDGRSSAPSNPRTEDCSQVTRPAPEFTILKARPNPQSIAPAESPPEDSIKESTGVQEETAAALSLSSSSVSGAMENLDLNDNADGDDGQVELDEFLVSALRNRTERLFLLRLDREFGNFINSSQEQLQFPSMNSYHRMVVHRVANYFNLKRFVDPQSKAIILSRTEKSAIPTLRFSDLVEEEEEQTIKPMILLRRDPKRLASGMATPDGSSETDRRFVPIKVREEAYAKARARIFDGQPAKPKSPGEGSESTSRSNSPSIGPIGSDSARLEMEDEASKQSKTKKHPGNRRQGSSSARSPDEQVDSDYIRQLNTSSPNSRNVSRSTSPSFGSSTEAGARTPNKGLKPKTKVSIGDLAVECVDSRRRKSTISNASISSSNYKPSVGLARTSSSSSSQDGFLSPGSNPPFTESPTLSTPMNLSKGPDYFGHHPSSSQGTISPMGGVGSRSSYTYPQGPGANKNIRNQGANFNQMNPINQMPNLGYNKNANGQTFGSKKFQKGSNHNNGGGGGGFNQNPMSHVSGPPNAAYQYAGNGGLFNPNINSNGINNNNSNNNNGTNNQYTHHPNANPGHDPSSYFGPPSDSAAPHHSSHGPPSYAFSGAQGQFSHMPNAGFSHHPGPNHQPNYYNSSHRGGRRFNNTYGQFSHPPQTHHQHHTRNHPQPHAPYQQGNPHHKHNNNNNMNINNNNNMNINNNTNFNNHTPRDDPSFSQGGPIGTRGMRMYDNMNPGFGQPPHGAEFSGHVLNAGGEFHGGPNMYPGYGGGHPQLPTGDNPPNAHRHRSYDGSWTGGTNHPQDTQGHSFNGAMSQTPAGGKKPFNNYSSVPPMNQHHFPPIGGGGGHQVPVNGGSVMQQPGSMMPLSNAGGAGGPIVYDVDRRPPKSSELFDPNGPQPQSSSSSSNSGMGYAGNSQQGSGDTVNVTLVDGSNQGFGAYSNPHQGQFQGQQQGSHTNTHHPLPHQAHASQYHHHSVPMNRSYSSSSSSGYGGSTSSPGPNANKKSSLLYDYSGLTAPFDSARSSGTDTERSPTMNHILEICDFDLQDEKLFMEIVAPLNGKLRRLKTNSNNNSISINQCNSSGSAGNGSSKESAGQCVVIFKNAAVATEALAAFQEGRETWMAPGAQLRFESSAEEEEEKGDEGVDQLPTTNEAAPLSEAAPSPRSSSAASSPMPSFSPSSSSPSSSPSLQPQSTTAATTTAAETRKQWRFNLRVWTPVLTNSTVPTGGSVVAGSSSPSRGILPVGVSPNSNSGGAGGSQQPGGVSSSLSRSESLEYTLHPCTEASQQCPDQGQDEVELDESQQGNNEEDEEEEEEGRASTLVSAVAQDEADSGRR